MHIKHQVLQVSVDGGLGVHRGLLKGQKVVELGDAHRQRLVLLHFEN